MTDPNAPYAATFQHIRLLADKRERLTEAQLDAENQVLHRIAADFHAGHISEDELCDVFLEFRKGAMAGFARRWKAVMPSAPVGRLRGLIKKREFDAIFAPDPDGIWRGEYPIAPLTSHPRSGKNVVYVLYDADNVPCYVGSTKDFHSRAKAHERDGKPFVRWLAYPCESRAAAYDLEERLLREHKPYLNKRT